MDQLNNTCIVEKIVDPEQENTVKSHNVLLKLLNPGLEENIWRNSPASTLLILKPAERHTLPSPRNQSKGEAEIEKTFAMCEAVLTPGSKSRSKKKRHKSKSPHLVPHPCRRSVKQQAQQQPSVRPQITTALAPLWQSSSPRNRKWTPKHNKTTEPDRHFGSTQWTTPNP